jgi:hypothetical protein
MNISETKSLLDAISAIDNRKVTAEVVDAWHQILGQIPNDIAKEALKLAQQDASIKYLEPRHIFAWAKEAAFRLDRNKVVEAEVLRGTPEPTCKHDKKLLSCGTCCRELSKQSHLISEDLHAYAKANIYA